jgi:hypothetical protein
MFKRNVNEWLVVWGEWERCGRAYLAHLQPKSSMAIWMDTVLPTERPPQPELDDDGAAWFCGLMSRLKRSRPRLYQLLHWIHVTQLSTREVSTRLNINRHRTDQLYERAVGWLDAMIEAEMGIAEINYKKSLQGGRH